MTTTVKNYKVRHRTRTGRYANTPAASLLGLEPRPAPYIIESISFSFSVFCPSPSPVLTAPRESDEPAFLNGTA